MDTEARYETVNEMVRAMLAAAGVPQVYLNAKMGVSNGLIGAWLSGAAAPGAGRLARLAAALYVEISVSAAGWRWAIDPALVGHTGAGELEDVWRHHLLAGYGAWSAERRALAAERRAG